MPLGMANDAARDVALVPLLQAKISELEFLALKRQERFLTLEVGFDLSEIGRVTALESSILEEQKRVIAEQKLKAWYRNPLLWFSVGAFVAISVETALILSIK